MIPRIMSPELKYLNHVTKYIPFQKKCHIDKAVYDVYGGYFNSFIIDIKQLQFTPAKLINAYKIF